MFSLYIILLGSLSIVGVIRYTENHPKTDSAWYDKLIHLFLVNARVISKYISFSQVAGYAESLAHDNNNALYYINRKKILVTKKDY